MYTLGEFKIQLDQEIQNKLGMLKNQAQPINTAVNLVSNVYHDMQSLIRRVSLVPQLFEDVYRYGPLDDLKNYKIIDIPKQGEREVGEFNLTSAEEFWIDKDKYFNVAAVERFNNMVTLLVKSHIDDKELMISTLDDVTAGGGTWNGYADGVNVAQDTFRFLRGNAGLAFDINSSGGTEAGIENTALDAFDISEYTSNGSLFVWHYIVNTNNINDYKVQIGDDNANYHEITTTTQHTGNQFVDGWNLLRFDFAKKTTVGTPSNTSTQFVRLFMTKNASKTNEKGYVFDWLTLKLGRPHYVKYYSKYPWQDGNTGARKSKADNDSDILIADEDEFQMYLKEAIVHAMPHTDATPDEIRNAQSVRDATLQLLKSEKPSESQPVTITYQDYI